MISATFPASAGERGDVAQLVEHLLCKQGVVGSSPIVSTRQSPLDAGSASEFANSAQAAICD